ERLGILRRLMVRGVFPGGPSRLWYFLCSMPWLAPSRIPLVVADWIIALSMRFYAEQQLFPQSTNDGALERRVGAVRRALATYLEAGKVTLSFRQRTVHALSICLKDLPDLLF